MFDNPLEESKPEPLFGMRRLAAAVILQAAVDFTETKDPRVWMDARRFLFPEDPGIQEHFRWTVEVAAIDPDWLRAHLLEARERTAVPSGIRSCSKCGSEFRGANCSQCRREKAAIYRRQLGIMPRPEKVALDDLFVPVRQASLTRPRAKGGRGNNRKTESTDTIPKRGRLSIRDAQIRLVAALAQLAFSWDPPISDDPILPPAPKRPPRSFHRTTGRHFGIVRA